MAIKRSKNQNKDGLVSVSIPRAKLGEEANLYVGLNGVNYLIPKGKTTLVPPYVAAEIERSRRAEDLMQDRAEGMRSKG